MPAAENVVSGPNAIPMESPTVPVVSAETAREVLITELTKGMNPRLSSTIERDLPIKDVHYYRAFYVAFNSLQPDTIESRFLFISGLSRIKESTLLMYLGKFFDLNKHLFEIKHACRLLNGIHKDSNFTTTQEVKASLQKQIALYSEYKNANILFPDDHQPGNNGGQPARALAVVEKVSNRVDKAQQGRAAKVKQEDARERQWLELVHALEQKKRQKAAQHKLEEEVQTQRLEEQKKQEERSKKRREEEEKRDAELQLPNAQREANRQEQILIQAMLSIRDNPNESNFVAQDARQKVYLALDAWNEVANLAHILQKNQEVLDAQKKQQTISLYLDEISNLHNAQKVSVVENRQYVYR